MLNRQHQGDRERGQVIILFALVLVVILLFAAIVVDLGMLRNDRQTLANSMDAAALAGGSQLPVDGDAAPKGNAAGSQWTLNQALIQQSVAANYPGPPALAFGTKAQYLAGSKDYYIEYRCLIGVIPAGQPSAGQPYLSRDVPTVCNPGGALGHTPAAADFSGAGATRVAPCNPTLQFNGHYDKCNVVVVIGAATTPYVIGPVVGILSGSTASVQSAACNGPCGAAPALPVDVVLIMDRTGSMSAQDIADIQTGAKSVLSVFNPAIQRVALGTIGPSVVGKAACPSGSTSPLKGLGAPANQVYGVGQSPSNNVNFFAYPADLSKWIAVGFSGTDASSPAVTFNEAYSANSVTNTNSTIWKAVSCLYSYTTGTNLDTPILMAQQYLLTFGRPGVKKGIILETDGTPQAGDGSAHYTCNAANNTATTAKSAPNNIEIFTIGFGISGATCPTKSGGGNSNANESTFWAGKPAASLLQSMATDASHFYNAPDSATLIAAFTAAATQLAGGIPHLVQLYPAPIVTGVAPATGQKTGGTGVTITGKYFTGATSVKFGATAVAFTFVSDTSITTTAPPGAANATVNVTVTTGGGVSIPSPIATADDYKYGP
jgi:hypothetical protein